MALQCPILCAYPTGHRYNSAKAFCHSHGLLFPVLLRPPITAFLQEDQGRSALSHSQGKVCISLLIFRDWEHSHGTANTKYQSSDIIQLYRYCKRHTDGPETVEKKSALLKQNSQELGQSWTQDPDQALHLHRPQPPRGTLMAATAPAQGTSGRTRSSDPHGAVGVPEGRTARAERAQSLTSSGSQAPRARAGPISSSENAEGIGRKGAGAGFIPLRGGCTRLCTRPGRGTVDGAGAARTALSQPSGSR